VLDCQCVKVGLISATIRNCDHASVKTDYQARQIIFKNETTGKWEGKYKTAIAY